MISFLVVGVRISSRRQTFTAELKNGEGAQHPLPQICLLCCSTPNVLYMCNKAVEAIGLIPALWCGVAGADEEKEKRFVCGLDVVRFENKA